MTWYFQYLLARDIAAAREAEASRWMRARVAKAESEEGARYPGTRQRHSRVRRSTAAAIASLARQTHRLARRLDADSVSEFDVRDFDMRNIARIGRDGEVGRA